MDSSAATHRYVSTYRPSLDGSNRITVPSAWRVKGEGGDLDSDYYLAWPHPLGHIEVYPPRKQDGFFACIDAVPFGDHEGQRMVRYLLGNASQFGCDKSGRISLPKGLMDHAGITDKVVLVGTGATFQIWSAERFDGDDDGTFNFLEALERLDRYSPAPSGPTPTPPSSPPPTPPTPPWG